MWVIKRLSSSADKPRSPHTMDAIKSRVFVCPDDDLGRWPAKQDSTQRGRWRRVFAWTNHSEEMQKLCRQMQLHCDGLWPRLRVGNCLASYLGIAAIDAAHKSARRAQEDIEATGPTFEGERQRKRETDMLTVCVAPGSKNVSFFSRNFWGVATVCDMFWFVSPMFMGLCCRESQAMRPTRCRCRCLVRLVAWWWSSCPRFL